MDTSLGGLTSIADAQGRSHAKPLGAPSTAPREAAPVLAVAAIAAGGSVYVKLAGPLVVADVVGLSVLAAGGMLGLRRERWTFVALLVAAAWLLAGAASALANLAGADQTLELVLRPLIMTGGLLSFSIPRLRIRSGPPPSHVPWGAMALSLVVGSAITWQVRYGAVYDLRGGVKFFLIFPLALGALAITQKARWAAAPSGWPLPPLRALIPTLTVAVLAAWSGSRIVLATMTTSLAIVGLGRLARAWRHRGALVMRVVAAVVALAVALGTYTGVARKGVLGENERRRAQQLEVFDEAVVLRVRPDSMATAAVALRRPWFGYAGVPESGAVPRDVRRYLETRGATLGPQFFEEEAPTHSMILGEWVRSGLLGATAILLLFVVTIAALAAAVTRRDLVATFVALTLAWDAWFSPLGDQRRFLHGFLLAALVMTVTRARTGSRRLESASAV